MRTQLPSVEEQFRATTTRSRELYEQALQVMPGGVTRTSIYSEPYPIYAARGEGCRVWDVDGTRRLDLVVNYTALVAGHAHPAVVEAIQEQAALGTSFAAPNPPEVRLATELVERVASIEKIRFTNSGTEATMMALRLARAHTGRTKFAKVEGGYHGSHDLVQEPEVAGTLPDVGEFAVVIPYNDAAGATAILDRHGAEVAAVIVEPILGSGGMIPADPEYLRALRAACDRHGSLLIFDEVISFRVARGGAQELYGIRPDLTTLGKVIGGGLPVAAFGGRADVMELLDPRRDPSIAQGGTYNGNPLGMAAGVATLTELTPDLYDDLNRKGARVCEELAEVFASHDVAVQVNGAGSMFALHFTDRPVVDYRSVAAADKSN